MTTTIQVKQLCICGILIEIAPDRKFYKTFAQTEYTKAQCGGRDRAVRVVDGKVLHEEDVFWYAKKVRIGSYEVIREMVGEYPYSSAVVVIAKHLATGEHFARAFYTEINPRGTTALEDYLEELANR